VAVKTIGVAAMGGDSKAVIQRIEDFEKIGIPAAWLTTGGAGLDGLTLFGAAAVNTTDIKLGTCITPTWPRHPITTVQQVQVLEGLAPGRFRLGVGPSHRPSIEQTYGFDFRTPLTNLREYLQIVTKLLKDGSVEFDGDHYHAHASIAEAMPNVPVMASALRPGSFRTCGELADGAISWVCPEEYLRDVAMPAMEEGAKLANRTVPAMVVHTPVCVHDDPTEVYFSAREQLGNYPRLPFYAKMFAAAGYPEALDNQQWSDRMINAVVFSGTERQVEDRIRSLFDWGVSEIIVTVVTAGSDRSKSTQRTLETLAGIASRL